MATKLPKGSIRPELRACVEKAESLSLAKRLSSIAALFREVEPNLPELDFLHEGLSAQKLEPLVEDFWREMFRGTGIALTLVFAWECAVVTKREEAVLGEMLERMHGQPDRFAPLGTLMQRLARGVSAEAFCSLRCAEVRAQWKACSDDPTDLVSELYAELLEEFADSPAQLAQVRELGKELEEARQRGELGRSLLRRGRDSRQSGR